jgi:AAA+ superfamily predicted ATPase
MADMKGEIITFKVSEEEAEMIRKAAKEEGMSVSRYLRACVLRDRGLSGDPVALKIVFDNFKETMRDVFGGKVDKESLEKGKEVKLPRTRKA